VLPRAYIKYTLGKTIAQKYTFPSATLSWL